MYAAGAMAGNNVYTWKSGSGSTSYSDTPNRLQPERSNIVNIRTRNVTPAVAKPENAQEGTLSEQQAKLNEKILAQNKQVEEQNKKVEEENRKNKEDNCRIARVNRQFAESARTVNRDDLIKHYQSDINKYCNWNWLETANKAYSYNRMPYCF